MVVLEPLKITIENLPNDKPITVSVPNFPSKPELGNHNVTLENTIYIESSDFMEVTYLMLSGTHLFPSAYFTIWMPYYFP